MLNARYLKDGRGIFLGMGGWMKMSSVYLRPIEVMEAEVKVEK